MRERERDRGCKKDRERDRNERNAKSSGVLSVLSDDMQGNELPDFMHQKRDAPHRLDCQRFLPCIGEMNPPPHNLLPSTPYQLLRFALPTLSLHFICQPNGEICKEFKFMLLLEVSCRVVSGVTGERGKFAA